MGSNCGRLLSIKLIEVATARPALDQIFESNNGEEEPPPELVLLVVVVDVVEDDEADEAGVLNVVEVVVDFCSFLEFGVAVVAAADIVASSLLFLDEDDVVVGVCPTTLLAG